MSDKPSCSGGGSGCMSFVIGYLLLWTAFVGLPTPWGKLNLDLIPPRIWVMPAEVKQVEVEK